MEQKINRRDCFKKFHRKNELRKCLLKQFDTFGDITIYDKGKLIICSNIKLKEDVIPHKEGMRKKSPE